MVCAVVLPDPSSDSLTFDELVTFCKEAGLMTQKIPERLEIVEEMPRAGTGKIVKKTLKEMFSK